jgi:hypothetical protein
MRSATPPTARDRARPDRELRYFAALPHPPESLDRDELVVIVTDLRSPPLVAPGEVNPRYHDYLVYQRPQISWACSVKASKPARRKNVSRRSIANEQV